MIANPSPRNPFLSWDAGQGIGIFTGGPLKGQVIGGIEHYLKLARISSDPSAYLMRYVVPRLESGALHASPGQLEVLGGILSGYVTPTQAGGFQTADDKPIGIEPWLQKPQGRGVGIAAAALVVALAMRGR